MKLSELAKRIEKHYGKPMDIEWAIDQDLVSQETCSWFKLVQKQFGVQKNGNTELKETETQDQLKVL